MRTIRSSARRCRARESPSLRSCATSMPFVASMRDMGTRLETALSEKSRRGARRVESGRYRQQKAAGYFRQWRYPNRAVPLRTFAHREGIGLPGSSPHRQGLSAQRFMPRLRYLARASPWSSSAFVLSPLAAMMSPRMRNPWPCLGPRSELLRELIAFVRRGLGRGGVEAEQRGRFDSEQLRFQSAKSLCPCNSKRGLSDVQGSLGIPGASVSPRRAPVDEVRYGRWISFDLSRAVSRRGTPISNSPLSA